MTNDQNDMKKLVEGLVKNLQSRGINVKSAAFLELGDKSQAPTQQPPTPLPGQVDMGKVKNILDTLAANGIRPSQPTQQIQDPNKGQEKCYCPDCFNFTSFEEVLREEGSIFDYLEIKLNGQQFAVKYHLSPGGVERVMIQKAIAVNLANLTTEQLQAELTEAVQHKEFSNAQQILNEINLRKNKN